jgi:hypothetical protein
MDEVIFQECQDLRLKLKELQDRLGEAETVLRYYANPTHYDFVSEGSKYFQNVLKNDNTQSDNVSTVSIAGGRARKYFEKFDS